MTMTHKFSWAVIIMALGLVGLFSFWQFYPYKPMEMRSITVPAVVSRGEVMTYQIDYCKYYEIPSTVLRQLIDGSTIFFPEVTTNNPVGCSVGNRYLELPDYIAGDDYKLRVTVIYRVNPIREVPVIFESNTFKIE